MKILVTGAAGFIGSHLVEALDCEVVTTDLRDGVDLSIPNRIERLMDTHQPDLVVHLAAQYGRLPCERDPFGTVQNNVAATVNVARACRDTPLVFVSSSEIYGDHGPFVIRENVAYRRLPHNLYGLTKRWGEEACTLYCPELLIARCNMVYGPRQQVGDDLAALPNFLNRARKRQPIFVHRGSERSWCYITDTVSALRLLIKGGVRGIYNVGRDDEQRPMREIAEIACDLTGAPTSLVEEIDPPDMQTVVKRIDMSALYGLGWKPTVSLEDGMKRTLDALG